MLGKHGSFGHMAHGDPSRRNGLSRRRFFTRSAGAAAALSTAGGVLACSTSTAPAAATVPGGTLGLGIVGMIVHDLQRSLDFYRTLGLAIPDHVTGDNFRMTLPTGQVFFWDADTIVRSFDPDWRPATGSRRIVLEFGFATPEAVDAKYTEMVDAGHPSYLSVRDLFGARYAVIVDPDGNQISLRYPLAS